MSYCPTFIPYAGKMYNIYNASQRNIWRIDVTTGRVSVRIDTNSNVQ